MGQHDLAGELFRRGNFTFSAVLDRQSNKVGNLLRDSSRIQASHG